MQDENAARSKRTSGNFRHAMDAGLGVVLLKLVVGLVIVLSLTGGLKTMLRPIHTLLNGSGSEAPSREGTRPRASRAPASQAGPSAADVVREPH